MIRFFNKRNIVIIFVLVLLIVDTLKTEHNDDYARQNRKRRPQHHQQYDSGPCGRFFGLSYITLNYNIDCSSGGHGNTGLLTDFQGGHGNPGSYAGGGLGNVLGQRPQKPHKPHKPHRPFAESQGGFFDKPIWGSLGSLASNLGTDLSGGNGAGFFDGSLINSFSNLFSRPPESSPSSHPPQRPPIINRPPAPVTIHAPSSSIPPPSKPQPPVPIVDLRPVHEEYYDEVTEAAIYSGHRYVSGHNRYDTALKKFNRQINHALNYFLKR